MSEKRIVVGMSMSPELWRLFKDRVKSRMRSREVDKLLAAYLGVPVPARCKMGRPSGSTMKKKEDEPKINF